MPGILEFLEDLLRLKLQDHYALSTKELEELHDIVDDLIDSIDSERPPRYSVKIPKVNDNKMRPEQLSALKATIDHLDHSKLQQLLEKNQKFLTQDIVHQLLLRLTELQDFEDAIKMLGETKTAITPTQKLKLMQHLQILGKKLNTTSSFIQSHNTKVYLERLKHMDNTVSPVCQIILEMLKDGSPLLTQESLKQMLRILLNIGDLDQEIAAIKDTIPALPPKQQKQIQELLQHFDSEKNISHTINQTIKGNTSFLKQLLQPLINQQTVARLIRAFQITRTYLTNDRCGPNGSGIHYTQDHEHTAIAMGIKPGYGIPTFLLAKELILLSAPFGQDILDAAKDNQSIAYDSLVAIQYLLNHCDGKTEEIERKSNNLYWIKQDRVKVYGCQYDLFGAKPTVFFYAYHPLFGKNPLTPKEIGLLHSADLGGFFRIAWLTKLADTACKAYRNGCTFSVRTINKAREKGEDIGQIFMALSLVIKGFKGRKKCEAITSNTFTFNCSSDQSHTTERNMPQNQAMIGELALQKLLWIKLLKRNNQATIEVSLSGFKKVVKVTLPIGMLNFQLRKKFESALNSRWYQQQLSVQLLDRNSQPIEASLSLTPEVRILMNVGAQNWPISRQYESIKKRVVAFLPTSNISSLPEPIKSAPIPLKLKPKPLQLLPVTPRQSADTSTHSKPFAKKQLNPTLKPLQLLPVTPKIFC